MPYRTRVDLRVREDQLSEWQDWADELGITVSELIRRSVPAYKNSQRRRTRTPLKVLAVPGSERSPT